MSQTLTGLGEAGSGSSLSEQVLQKISPQFLQWCCSNKDKQESFQLKGLLLFCFGLDRTQNDSVEYSLLIFWDSSKKLLWGISF